MSNKNGNSDVDFDFFDDPPGSPRSARSVQRTRSPEPERRLTSPESHHSRSRSRSPEDRRRSRSRSRSPEDRRRSRSASRSHSSRSRSRSYSPDRRSRSADYSEDDYSDDPEEKSPPPKRKDLSRSPSPVSDNQSKHSHVVHVKLSDKSNYKGHLSDASVDSDVTDVSPLNSPPAQRKTRQQFSPLNERPPNSGKRRPTSAKSNNSDYTQHKVHEDDDSLNMKLLMEVLELEQDDPRKQEQLARARKVLFVPTKAKPHDKKNFSFSNDEVHMIDRENQRLMEKIMRSNQETNTTKQRMLQKTNKRKSKPVLTSSALNRQRQQQKIEQENLAMLRRLQGTKATKTLRRDQLLHEYQGKLIAGQSVAAAHSGYMSPSHTYTETQYDHAYSMADITEPATVVLNADGSKRRSRPASASTIRSNISTGKRPSSGKVRPQSAKISYNDRYEVRKAGYDDRW